MKYAALSSEKGKGDEPNSFGDASSGGYARGDLYCRNLSGFCLSINLTVEHIKDTCQRQASASITIRRRKDSLCLFPFEFHFPSELPGRLFIFLVLLILPVASISAESDQRLAAKITGVWVGRDIVYSSDVEVQTTYRADGTMTRLAKFSEDRRTYKLSIKGRWKVEQGQLVSVRESFSGQTEHSVEEIIAVTDKNLLLRAENGRLIHFTRK